MWITVDKNSKISLTRQIYSKIKEDILSGKLRAYETIPPTRKLCKELDVSRNVVIEAYSQLNAEGYIESRQGAATRVCAGIYLNRKKHSNNLFYINASIEKEDIIDFRSGVPDLKLFDNHQLGILYNKICTEADYKDFMYCSPDGRIELKKALAEYLYRNRGISCQYGKIMITNGATQALSILCELLYKQNGQAVVEDPCHSGLINVIKKAGYIIKAVCVDNKGIKPELINENKNICFIYVTPSHQFPMGSVLSIQRRIELIKIAEKENCYIIEDDYDSEYRYDGQPISSLYELCPERVIYIGSFSKILAPALRCGYVIIPDKLIFKFMQIKMYRDVHTETMTQLVLAKFIEHGFMERHIWKMKKEYIKKRETMIKSLSESFDNNYEIMGQSAGLHMVVKFNNIIFTDYILKKLKENKVKVYPVENYAIYKGKHNSEVILGYGHLTCDEIQKGIKIMQKVLF